MPSEVTVTFSFRRRLPHLSVLLFLLDLLVYHGHNIFTADGSAPSRLCLHSSPDLLPRLEGKRPIDGLPWTASLDSFASPEGGSFVLAKLFALSSGKLCLNVTFLYHPDFANPLFLLPPFPRSFFHCPAPPSFTGQLPVIESLLSRAVPIRLSSLRLSASCFPQI